MLTVWKDLMGERFLTKVCALIAMATLANGSFGQDGARVEPGATNSVQVTIEDMVNDALAKNPELEFYRAEIRAAKGERRAAGAYPNPELSVEAGRKRVTGLAGEGTAWTVSVAQPLEFPGRLGLRKAIANRQIELAEMGLQQFQATLASTVKSLAYRVYAAQAQAEASERIAARSQELMETLVQRDPAGINSLLESRLIEASIITINKRATETLTTAKNLIAELNQLRGQPLNTGVKIAPTKLDFPMLSDVESLVEKALTNNFDVRSQWIELAQQGLRVDLTRKDRWKEVTVAPFYSQERAGDRESVVGVGVSIPVPLWNRNTGNIKAQEARHEQAEVSLGLMQRRVEREVRERVTAYNARLGQMARWRPDVLQSLNESAELADRHYRLGAVPVTTYLELQEKYLEAQEAILNTQTEALQDLQRLNLTVGDYARAINNPNP